MKSAFATAAALVGAASAAYQPQGYGYGSHNGNLSTTMTTPTKPTYGGSFTSEYAEPTVTAIVSSFTTVCPSATHLTYGGKTYTVSESTTLTITDCPCTITTPVQSYHEPTVTAIVSSYETYCPHPTTFTAGTSTYTVTEATTVTVTNAGDCTITTPIGSLPHKPTGYPQKPTWTYEKPSTTPQTTPEKPKPSVYVPTWNATTKYTTETVSSYTTYCPVPTTISHGSSTITVTSPTTVTFTNCPCTITKPYVPATYYTTEQVTKTEYVTCPTPGTYTIGTKTTTVTQPTTLTATITKVQTSAVVTTAYVEKPVPTTYYPKPETTTYTKEISTVLVTYCPAPTTIITMGTTYPVQTPGTVTVPYVSTSVYTSVKPAPPQPTVYQPAPSMPAPQQPSMEAPAPPVTTPAAPVQPPATTGRVITQISDGQIQAPTAGTGAAQPPAQSQPVEEQPSASASPSVQPYTGSANKMASSGAGVIALIAGALFF